MSQTDLRAFRPCAASTWDPEQSHWLCDAKARLNTAITCTHGYRPLSLSFTEVFFSFQVRMEHMQNIIMLRYDQLSPCWCMRLKCDASDPWPSAVLASSAFSMNEVMPISSVLGSSAPCCLCHPCRISCRLCRPSPDTSDTEALKGRPDAYGTNHKPLGT